MLAFNRISHRIKQRSDVMRKVDYINETLRKGRLTKRAWLREFMREKKRSIKIFFVSTGTCLTLYSLKVFQDTSNTVENWAHHLLLMTVPEIIPQSARETYIPNVCNDVALQAKWEKLFCKLDATFATGLSSSWLQSKFNYLGEPFESKDELMTLKEFLTAVKTKGKDFYTNFKTACGEELS